MAANTQALCTSFKKELMQGFHAFGSGYRSADSFYAALYITNSSLGAATTAYSTTGEVTGTGYTPGGQALPAWNAPATSGTGAYTTPTAGISWTGITVTSSFDAVLIYNQSQGGKAVGVCTFTAAPNVIAGTVTINMPINALGTALLQIN